MPGMTFGGVASKPSRSEDFLRRQQQMAGDDQRRQTEADNQQRRMTGYANQASENGLLAQKYALDQSHMMQQNSDNEREVTDTSMWIGNKNSVANSGASGSRGSSGSGSGGGQLPPNIDGHYMPLINMDHQIGAGGSGLPREKLGDAAYSTADAQAFQDAEFGKAKATAGSLGRSAVESLRGEMAGRGIGGSGTEMRGVSDRIAAATNPLADLNVAHLGQDYAHAQRERDIAESRVSQQFQGDVTQRGQDMSTAQALESLKAALATTKYQGGISQRQTDIQALLQGLKY